MSFHDYGRPYLSRHHNQVYLPPDRQPFSSRRVPPSPRALPPRLPGTATPFAGNVVLGAIVLTCGGIWLLSSDAVQRQRDKFRNLAAVSRDSGSNIRTVDDYRKRPRATFAQFLKNPIGVTRAVVNYDFVCDNLVLSWRNVEQGRYWTILTHTFTHVSGTHLLMNMFGVWNFAPGFVAQYGVARFAGVWLSGGIAGAATGLLAEQRRQKPREGRPGDTSMLGASASVLSLVVASLIPRLHTPIMLFPIPISFPAWLGLSGFVAFSIFCEATGVIPGLGHASHLGGMAVGAMWGLSMLRRRPPF